MNIEIDNKHTALLVLDLQNHIIHEDSPLAAHVPFAAMVKKTGLLYKINRVLDASRAGGIEVVFIRVDYSRGTFPRYPKRGDFCQMVEKEAAAGNVMRPGQWGYDFHKRIIPLAGEHIFSKLYLSAFSGSSDLQEYLERKGITDIVLTGVATTFVVMGTVWAGIEKGYSCIVLNDCCIAASARLQDAAIEILNPISDVVDSDEFVAAIRG